MHFPKIFFYIVINSLFVSDLYAKCADLPDPILDGVDLGYGGFRKQIFSFNVFFVVFLMLYLVLIGDK